MSNFYEGAVIEVKIAGMIDHPGILVHDGLGWCVIHNSYIAGGVVISTLADFAGNRKIHFSSRYRNTANPFLIVKNARLKLGTKWSPLYNCQHFVSDVCGLKPQSHDLNLICALVASFSLASMLVRR
ncbi:MAG: hypothetical protein ACRBB3_08405 [Alphaproteobacteria bacterium]